VSAREIWPEENNFKFLKYFSGEDSGLEVGAKSLYRVKIAQVWGKICKSIDKLHQCFGKEYVDLNNDISKKLFQVVLEL